MSDHYDAAGYEVCVLDSSEDYEPYGYLSPELRQAELVTQPRNSAFERVIEAQLLAHWSMVGC